MFKQPCGPTLILIQLKLGHKEPSLRSPGAEGLKTIKKHYNKNKKHTKTVETNRSTQTLAIVTPTLIHTSTVQGYYWPKQSQIKQKLTKTRIYEHL